MGRLWGRGNVEHFGGSENRSYRLILFSPTFLEQSPRINEEVVKMFFFFQNLENPTMLMDIRITYRGKTKWHQWSQAIANRLEHDFPAGVSKNLGGGIL